MKFSKDHEWARQEGDKAVIGITEYAQDQLGDVVFVEMPAVGDKVKQNDRVGTIESVKTVSDIFVPVSGEVIAINEEIESDPSIVNQEPYGKGWLFEIRLSNPAELDSLLTEEQYKEICK